jgi:hypothetical protein
MVIGPSPASPFCSGAALVPLHDGEIFLPKAKNLRQRHQRIARSAGQYQKNGIAPVLAADRDVLVDAIDANEVSLDDAVRRGDGEGRCILMLAPGAIGQRTNGDDQHEDNKRPQDAED